MQFYNQSYLNKDGHVYHLSSLQHKIRGVIHIPTVKLLQELQIPTSKIYKLMKNFSQIAIKYLTHIILNKQKLEKKQTPIPLY